MLRSVCRPFADREKITKSSAYNKQFIGLSESSSRISVELDEFKNSGRYATIVQSKVCLSTKLRSESFLFWQQRIAVQWPAGKYYMLAHHIVVQHKLIEQCVQRLVSSTHFSKLLFSVLSTPRLSFVSFSVLLCTYSSSSVITSPFVSLLVL